jgi:Domain of unknown function (DUF4112)
MQENNKIGGKPIPQQLQKIARLTKLMDSQFKIPGTKFSFGLDPLIGLVPGLGSVIDYAISAYLLIAMIQNGASGRTVAKMFLNISIDGIVGAIPVLGNVFDFFYKANRKNLVLAVEHFEEGKHQGSAWPVVLPILIVLAIILGIFGILTYYALKFILLLFEGNIAS